MPLTTLNIRALHDKLVGGEFEKGLAKLKEIVEVKPAA